LAAVLLLAWGFGYIAWRLISGFPAQIQVFAGLITVSMYLVAGGLVALVFIIPVSGPNTEIKTEFYSARGAYFCIIAGLVLALVVSMGLMIALQSGRLYVPGAK
jgi:hypothetical protein